MIRLKKMKIKKQKPWHLLKDRISILICLNENRVDVTFWILEEEETVKPFRIRPIVRHRYRIRSCMLFLLLDLSISSLLHHMLHHYTWMEGVKNSDICVSEFRILKGSSLNGKEGGLLPKLGIESDKGCMWSVYALNPRDSGGRHFASQFSFHSIRHKPDFLHVCCIFFRQKI